MPPSEQPAALGFQELVSLLCKEHEKLNARIEDLSNENQTLRAAFTRGFGGPCAVDNDREGFHSSMCIGTRPLLEAAPLDAASPPDRPAPSGDPPCAQDAPDENAQAPARSMASRPSTMSRPSNSSRRPSNASQTGMTGNGRRRLQNSSTSMASADDDRDCLPAAPRTTTASVCAHRFQARAERLSRRGSSMEFATSSMAPIFAWVWVRAQGASSSTLSEKDGGQQFSSEAAYNMMGQGCVINPERSAFLEVWDVVTIIALAFVAIVAPIQVCMFEAKLDPLFAINCCVDMIFVVDLILQFFIMYPKRTNYGYALVHDQHKIITHYLKTWFAIDVISIVPFDLVGMLSESEEMKKMKGIKVIRLLRLLKLLRVLKASRLFRRFEVRMSITYGTFALLKFFCILLLITHWLANLWALTLVLIEEDEGVPRWIDEFDARDRDLAVSTKESPIKLYMTCVYFTSYTITSVGYGDIGPKNIVETVVCTIMIVVSGISWAIVLGQVVGTIANLNKDEQVFRSTMDELNLMMIDRVMPTKLRMRLRSFFLSNKLAQSRARHMQVLDAMSPGLQREVTMQINRRWIQHVSFLEAVLREAEMKGHRSRVHAFIVGISMGLQTTCHAQDDVFEAAQSLCILVRGLVSRNQQLHSAGAVWGVDFVLSNLGLLEPFQCWALTYVEVMTLQRERFFQLVEEHDNTCPGLKRKVRWFVCWLATQRAVLREAKHRRRMARTSGLMHARNSSMS